MEMTYVTGEWQIKVTWKFEEDRLAMIDRMNQYQWEGLSAAQRAGLTYVMASCHNRGGATFPSKPNPTDAESREVLRAIQDFYKY